MFIRLYARMSVAKNMRHSFGVSTKCVLEPNQKEAHPTFRVHGREEDER